jgi:phage gpG-like protein
MADFGIDFDFAALDEIIDEIESVGDRASDINPVLEGRIHDLHNQQMRRTFDTEGATSRDGAWRPLAPTSKKGRAILNQTGDLRDSYSNPNHIAHLWRIGENEVIGGSTHRIAEIHERGGRKIPRRSVQKSEIDLEAIDDLAWKFVLGELEG